MNMLSKKNHLWIYKNALLIVLVGCYAHPEKIFLESYGVMYDSLNQEATREKINSIIQKNKNHFYTYGLWGDFYQYSDKYDTAEIFYKKSDSAFDLIQNKMSDLEKFDAITDGKLITYEDMVAGWMENELLRGRFDNVKKIWENINKGLAFRADDGAPALTPGNALEYRTLILYTLPCDSNIFLEKQITERLEKFRQKEKDSSRQSWGGYRDIKTYIDLYEITNKENYLDSASKIMTLRDRREILFKVMSARIYVNRFRKIPPVDSVGNSMYGIYVKRLLENLVLGKTYYGTNRCGDSTKRF